MFVHYHEHMHTVVYFESLPQTPSCSCTYSIEYQMCINLPPKIVWNHLKSKVIELSVTERARKSVYWGTDSCWFWSWDKICNVHKVLPLLYYHASDPGSWTGDPQLGTVCFIFRTCCTAVGLLLVGLEETFLAPLVIIIPLSIAVHGHGIQTQSGRTATNKHTQ